MYANISCVVAQHACKYFLCRRWTWCIMSTSSCDLLDQMDDFELEIMLLLLVQLMEGSFTVLITNILLVMGQQKRGRYIYVRSPLSILGRRLVSFRALCLRSSSAERFGWIKIHSKNSVTPLMTRFLREFSKLRSGSVLLLEENWSTKNGRS